MSEKIGNVPFWRFFASFWAWVFYVLIGYDIFSKGLLVQTGVMSIIAVVYCSTLVVYCAEKEFWRWKHVHKHARFGEFHVIAWTAYVFFLVVLLPVVFHSNYAIPLEVVGTYIIVICLLAVTRELKNIHSKKYRKGFTLIELLVVIAIIAILSSIVLSSLQSGRAKGRDASRLRDFNTIKTALEFFYESHGHYPCYGLWAYNGNSPYLNNYSWSVMPEYFLKANTAAEMSPYCPVDGTGNLVAGGFLPSVPLDPLNTGTALGNFHMYVYEAPNNPVSGSQTYILYTKLESNDGLMSRDGGLCDNLYETGPGLGTVHAAAAVHYMDITQYSCE